MVFKINIMINNLKQQKINRSVQRKASDQNKPQYDMIVFCHLRWEFVYQRPQHIISRMGQSMKILFIEEPIHDPQNRNFGNLIVVNDNIHVLQSNVSDIASIADIMAAWVSHKNIPFGWFYSASFCPLLDYFEFDTIVYDCMDELSLFKGAPEQLINQEKYLMANADIIFTGGKSLYESKKQFHNNVHCFPSSVDEPHFAKALNGITVPDDISLLPSPIVGYYGVIDERIDLELLRKTAEQLPDVSFVMIGPLAKIHESELPKAANIHYLGMKSYDELPHYLKAFDIAMMPFALNDATKYISPTKTLEYMAARKPIISTRIIDVVRDYDHCVSLIGNAEEFINAITFLCDDTDRIDMENDYVAILEKTSWDSTAREMNAIIKLFAK
jgi:glycosyltransferase involved in cell wall biosynthesis